MKPTSLVLNLLSALAIVLSSLPSPLHAENALLPAGKTTDPLGEEDEFRNVTNQIKFVTDAKLNNDPLDDADVSSAIRSNGEAAANDNFLLYKAQPGHYISHVMLSYATYADVAGPDVPVGLVDSQGDRIEKDVTYPINVEVKDTGATAAANPDWKWFTVEADLPYKAKRLDGDHKEPFEEIKVKIFAGPGWTPHIGTVQLTVSPIP
jgi:hypothetical protein